ncbi:MAG: bacteriohemerythrin [Terracidiphilus sp.]
MALLNWSEKYSVGVKSLDNQHTALVGTLNELHTAMLKGQAASVTGNLLRKLVEYTRNHFAQEEALMSRAGYPGLETHRTQHHELTKQVGEYVERYERGEITLNLHLLNFLRDWLANHIQKSDKEYGPWLNQHGVQ